MANSLAAVTPRLLAMGLMALRQNAIMPLLVNRMYDAQAAQKGSTIDVPIPSAIATQDVTPAAVPPSTADVAPTYVSLVMDQWKEAPFYMTDNDYLTAMDGIIPMTASEAIKSLANTVDAYLLGLYKGVYGIRGTVSTGAYITPFATDTSDATNVRATLNKQLAPLGDRRFVLNPDAEGAALNLRAFQDASWIGTAETIQNGTLTPRLGFQWLMDQNCPTHTAGTITTGLIAKASTAVAVGGTTCVATTAASTGACALVVGDIILFAGDTQTYVLTAAATQASAATDVTLTFQPGLAVAKVGSEAITVKPSHSVNLAFHRDAFAFASRPLVDSAEGLGHLIQSAVDPVSGLTLRLEVSREHKRTRFSYDILYGAKLVRAPLACRLAGAI